MATITTAPPALLTIEQYLRRSYSPDVDFVEDHIEERNLGEFDHGRLQGLLFAHFFVKEKSWAVTAVVEQRIRVAGERVRICDLTLLKRGVTREPVTLTPPLVCIEILSPEDRLSRAKLVLADYYAMGVENIWLIDSIQRIAYTFGNTGLSAPIFDTLTVPNTAITLGLQQLFADLDGEDA